ncbi:heparan-alpha-glucosaminide N-acetyltransferase [Chrysoperla carnea]|uniref:heparan-alpha-glucosaminide N-acetyltransferase n=1 Tax=Chrysoperla carnea TaxID=189513 RepID=UPI001D07988D|nr:heparan-alpha-glucosaminide N-acetyltransferase [Chrysoperla carnea]
MEYFERFLEHTSSNDLNVDECLITYNGTEDLNIFSIYKECYHCSEYEHFKTLSQSSAFIYKIVPNRRWKIRFATNESIICNITPNLGEFGEYELQISNATSCHFKTLKQPVNIYYPLFAIPILLFLSIFIPFAYTSLRELLRKKDSEPPTSVQKTKSKRVTAIDTFRGICIVMMIFVNDGAGAYRFLEHAVWNGLQFADVIFPWFMWIMGFCIPISIQSQLKKRVNRFQIFAQILQRSITLFIIGLGLNTVASGANVETIRICGVYQRFAVCYFVVGVIMVIFTRRDYGPPKSTLAETCEDILKILPQWIVIGILVAVHTCVIFLIEFPGCPKGYLGPGGFHENGEYFNCTGGITRYIDEFLLGKDHMYQWPEIITIYKAPTFDPENILGCLTSIFQVFLGVQAGVTLRTHKSKYGRINRWIIWGVITGIVGGILCQFKIEDGWIPINKNLWSLSFVLVTSSLAYFLFAFCYYLIDVLKLWSGRPFLYPGTNVTIIFVGHMVCYQMFPFHFSFSGMNTHFILLLENLWSTIIWVIIAYCLWRNEFFLSI